MTAAPQKPLDISSLLINSSSSNFYQDIAAFLRKPVVLATGNLSITDTVGTSLLVKNLPFDGFSASPLYLDKIRGHLGWRGTMHLRWQVNGNRFQSGRYFINYIPTLGSPPTQNNTAESILSHNATLVQRTQTFKTSIDVNCDTEASMCIPYVSTMNFVPLRPLTSGTYFGNLGQLNMWAYAPLQAVSGPTTASWTLWIHFEDIEMIGPTHPQSGKLKFKASTKKKKGSPTTDEQESQDIGPVQGTLIKLSDATSHLTGLPLIGDFAKTVSWLTDRLAGVSSIFGWSSPINLAPVHRMNRETMPWFCNIDSSDQSLPLSLSVKNEIQVMPGYSGTDIDEMDFNFLKTIPAWSQTVTWTETQVYGTKIFDTSVSPYFGIVTTTAATTTLSHYAPFQFIATYFNYWRGSIVYTFKFVKTEFHSGRLAVVYYPQENRDNDYAGVIADSHYAHREIIDIRYCNEVTFNIPYISSSPWKPAAIPACIVGEFCVYVVDPLVAPATAPNNVQILVEVAGGPDLEFSVPTRNNIAAMMNTVPQGNPIAFIPKKSVDFRIFSFPSYWKKLDNYEQHEYLDFVNSISLGSFPQSEFHNPKPQRNDCELTESTLGNARPFEATGINEVACVGESITSFRALGKKAVHIPYANLVTAIPLSTVEVLPFASSIARYNGTTVDPVLHLADLYSVLNSIYGLSRGGVRLKFFNEAPLGEPSYPYYTYISPAAPGSMTSFYPAMIETGNSELRFLPTFSAIQNINITYHQEQTNLCSEVQVPMYHQWHSRVNSVHAVSGTNNYYGSPNTRDLSTQFSVVHRSPSATGTGNVMVARSFSDDTDFGVFISIPPMFSPPSVTPLNF